MALDAAVISMLDTLLCGRCISFDTPIFSCDLTQVRSHGQTRLRRVEGLFESRFGDDVHVDQDGA
jgi:hypothetical protein